MPYNPAPIVNPLETVSPVIFDMQANLADLPAIIDDPSIHPIPAYPPTPITFGAGTLSCGVDLASMQSIGSISSFNYTVGNQTATAYQNQLMGSCNSINYPITASAINASMYYNAYYNQQFNAQIHYNYAPDQTGQYQYIVTPSNGYCSASIVETDEQRTERETCELAYQVKRDGADKRAEELLMCILNDKQKDQYIKFGYFETEINDKIYRIRKGRSGNVRVLKGDKEIEKYCAHPSDAYAIPEHDSMIAQYLMLRSDEKAFLAKANRTVLY